MKNIILLLSLLFIISCKGQIDLEKIKVDEKVTFLDNLEKDNSIYVPLEGVYKVKNIENFKLFDLSLNNDSLIFKDETITYSNLLNIIVDSYEKNNYLGFELKLINEKQGNQLFNLLKVKYGKPLKKSEYLNNLNIQINYLWQDKSSNQIILYSKHNESGHLALDGKNEILSETRIIILKDGLSIKPDMLDSRNTKENIETLLKSNPKAFDILEIFKSQIQD